MNYTPEGKEVNIPEAQNELFGISEYDRIVREKIKSLVDTGVPLKEAIKTVINS